MATKKELKAEIKQLRKDLAILSDMHKNKCIEGRKLKKQLDPDYHYIHIFDSLTEDCIKDMMSDDWISKYIPATLNHVVEEEKTELKESNEDLRTSNDLLLERTNKMQMQYENSKYLVADLKSENSRIIEKLTEIKKIL
jgi:hypothetical protein